MKFKFTQHEVESGIYKILAYGDEIDIAKRTGKSASIYSQMFNPDDERESNIFKAVREMCAELDISQERGIKLFCFVKSIIERHIESDIFLSVNAELEKADKEFSDIWKARLKGKTAGEQLIEIEEAETQLAILKRAVVDDVKAEIKSSVFAHTN